MRRIKRSPSRRLRSAGKRHVIRGNMLSSGRRVGGGLKKYTVKIGSIELGTLGGAAIAAGAVGLHHRHQALSERQRQQRRNAARRKRK